MKREKFSSRLGFRQDVQSGLETYGVFHIFRENMEERHSY